MKKQDNKRPRLIKTQLSGDNTQGVGDRKGSAKILKLGRGLLFVISLLPALFLASVYFLELEQNGVAHATW